MGPSAIDGVRPLSDDEIDEFIKSLDKDSNGEIGYDELEWKLDQVHKELNPKPMPHHMNHKDRDDEQRHIFLRSIIGDPEKQKKSIPADEFKSIVKSWQIPSLEQDKEAAKEEDNHLKKLKLWRRVRVYWSVSGPEWCFMALVIAATVGMSVWQMHKYITGPQYRAALGWGVVLAKTCAGAIYIPFFFLLLSMSRYFATFCRKSYYISRFVNWDYSQSFHIRISIAVMVLATLHAIGHLTGSFVWGSRDNREPAVEALLGPGSVPRSYLTFVQSIPGWSGLTALGCFYLLAGMSMPQIRKWSYEVFQLGHLLMFPIIGLLAAHGTAQLLQWAMLGYFLAFPTILIIGERLLRVFQGLHRIDATVECLDKETVCVTANIPAFRPWPYKAGQYVFLQVPQLSFFQWHPFTISTCHGLKMQLHVKNDGDWTGELYELAKSGEGKPVPLKVGIDGPFGAPAQRFHDFDYTIIVGAGVGVTPFSGILTDLQQQEDEWQARERALRGEKPTTTTNNNQNTTTNAPEESSGEETLSPAHPRSTTRKPSHTSSLSSASSHTSTPRFRRADFHWLVRERSTLLWFAELLNTITKSQSQAGVSRHLDINLLTHVTQKRKDISEHTFRWLLELHRTERNPHSPLTGLLNQTHFGRPDLPGILTRHYEEMCALRAGVVRVGARPGSSSSSASSSDGSTRRTAAVAVASAAHTIEPEKELEPTPLNSEQQAEMLDGEKMKVGVFFCGPPVIGYALADACWEITARSREEGTGVEYSFMIEVFG